MIQFFWFLGLAIFGLASCTPGMDQSAMKPPPYLSDTLNYPIIKEVLRTESEDQEDMDYPAIWSSAKGGSRLIVSAKVKDLLQVYDIQSGKLILKFGRSGNDSSEFRRPLGLAVVDNLLFAVEAANRRVQVFELPTYRNLGFFALNSLLDPRGIYAYRVKPGRYRFYVTDNYLAPNEEIPPDRELGNRIVMYELAYQQRELSVVKTLNFGEIVGEGILHEVESIHGDPAFNHLLISDEIESNPLVKIYTLDGKFTGKTFGRYLFTGQPEAMALYETGPNTGYWIITDKSRQDNMFHLFERGSLKHIGGFQCANVTNTNGIALWNKPIAQFKKGLFVAIDDESRLCLFDWSEIEQKLAPKK
jgi:3-phytase